MFTGIIEEVGTIRRVQKGRSSAGVGNGARVVVGGPVSFKHLTPPTKRVVEDYGGGGSIKKKRKYTSG